jgi:hypothetical protein
VYEYLALGLAALLFLTSLAAVAGVLVWRFVLAKPARRTPIAPAASGPATIARDTSGSTLEDLVSDYYRRAPAVAAEVAERRRIDERMVKLFGDDVPKSP